MKANTENAALYIVSLLSKKLSFLLVLLSCALISSCVDHNTCLPLSDGTLLHANVLVHVLSWIILSLVDECIHLLENGLIFACASILKPEEELL